jgi:hypothetical protein
MDRATLLTFQNKQILFGRPHGEKTLGTIVKVNVNKCKVRQDDMRGNAGRPIGTIWNVPFELIYIRDANGNATVPPPAPVVKKPITDFWIMDHKHELNILDGIYGCLSPENLTCDGENPLWRVRQLRAELERKLRACFVLLEREVDEMECGDCMERMKKLEAEGKTTAFAVSILS